MINNGAVFFDHMSKGKQNKFEVKTIQSTLGFLETGLIRELDDLKHGVGKFGGEGLEQKGPSRNEEELDAEVKRLNCEIDSYIIIQNTMESEANMMSMLCEDQQKRLDE